MAEHSTGYGALTAAAGGSPVQAPRAATSDGIANFAARIGAGADQDNLLAKSRYALNPITRARGELEAIYRGSWLAEAAVGVIADDMTRAGVDFTGSQPPEDNSALDKCLQRTGTWDKICETTRWSRLYGGAVGVIMIDGQDLSQPLKPEATRRGAYRGLLVLDRWQLSPSQRDFVTDYGPHFGEPATYDVLPNVRWLPRGTIHWTRVVRMEGLPLPAVQKQAENGWGMSVLEPFYDRLAAFDSATLGAAQMMFRAYLRTLKVKNLRSAIIAGGPALDALYTNIEMIRRYQSNEGITLLDADDGFETASYGFGGIDSVLIQLAQQMSGALGIPIVKLFGQSPAGFSTGDTDLQSYYDNIKLRQERTLRSPLTRLLGVAYRSELGKDPPADFDFNFSSLWGMSALEKAQVAATVSGAVADSVAKGVLKRSTALRELKQSSDDTGIFTQITPEDIDDAVEEEEAPPPALLASPEPGEPGSLTAATDPGAGTVGDPPSWMQEGRRGLRVVGERDE